MPIGYGMGRERSSFHIRFTVDITSGGDVECEGTRYLYGAFVCKVVMALDNFF